MTTHRFFAGCLAFISLAACASGGDTPPPTIVSAPAAPAEPAYLRSDIDGASAAALDALFGDPGLIRKEGDGEFRRYQLAECALLVILYPDETGTPRTAHMEATALSSDREKPNLDACLAAG